MSADGLIGTIQDGYRIERLLHEGSYARLYLAVRETDSSQSVVKVATRAYTQHLSGWTLADTHALAMTEEGWLAVSPNPADLVELEAARLREVPGARQLATVEKSERGPGTCFYRMTLIPGDTLEQLHSRGSIASGTVVAMLRDLERLRRAGDNWQHGNLSPENIMVTEAGARMVDPGYFGKLAIPGQDVLEVALTSPAYYPALRPDDLLAAAIIVWELVLGRHPFDQGQREAFADMETACAEVNRWQVALAEEGLGGLAALVGMKRPAEVNGDIDPELEEVLLRGLRLEIATDGKLTGCDGYRTLHEYLFDLNRVFLNKRLETL